MLVAALIALMTLTTHICLVQPYSVKWKSFDKCKNFVFAFIKKNEKQTINVNDKNKHKIGP